MPCVPVPSQPFIPGQAACPDALRGDPVQCLVTTATALRSVTEEAGVPVQSSGAGRTPNAVQPTCRFPSSGRPNTCQELGDVPYYLKTAEVSPQSFHEIPESPTSQETEVASGPPIPPMKDDSLPLQEQTTKIHPELAHLVSSVSPASSRYPVLGRELRISARPPSLRAFKHQSRVSGTASVTSASSLKPRNADISTVQLGQRASEPRSPAAPEP